MKLERRVNYHKGQAAIRHYANKGTFNQEKALVGAFSVITNLRVDLRFKLYLICFSFRHSSLFRSFCDPPSSVMTLVLS